MFSLFNMELWERFSYYGMKALVIYYMYYEVSQGGLDISKELASSVMAVYGSLVFLTGIIGGWVADRLLGNRHKLFCGAGVVIVGHITLSLRGGSESTVIEMMFRHIRLSRYGGSEPLSIGMLVIILASGYMNPNISNMVGELYSPTSNKRDAAFSLFYMAVNIGALVSPFVVSTVGREVNFHLGFSLAAIGMALGLIVYIVTNRKYLGDIGKEVKNPLKSGELQTFAKRVILGLLVFILLVFVAFYTGHLSVQLFINFISVLGLLIPASYFIVMIF